MDEGGNPADAGFWGMDDGFFSSSVAVVGFFEGSGDFGEIAMGVVGQRHPSNVLTPRASID
jgi:hypothetical protein